MPYNQPKAGHSSLTFELLSKFADRFDSPARTVSDMSLVAVGGPNQFVDGEYLHVTGNRRVEKVDATELANATTGAAYARACFQAHGNPNRSDLQFGQIPVIYEKGYRFKACLIDSARLAEYLPGVEVSIGIVDTPKAGVAGLVPTAGSAPVRATCLSGVQSDGFVEFQSH